jgi:hypothetical protein
MLEGALAAAPYFHAVAMGTETVIDSKGVERPPTFGERLDAWKELLRYGLGTKSELTGEDGDALRVDSAPLKNFSKEELLALESILAGDSQP